MRYEFSVNTGEQFRIDDAGSLWRGDLPVELEFQLRQALGLLVEKAGQTVSKQEFRERLGWPANDRGADGRLYKLISNLRKTLGEQSIRIVPKAGYHFSPAVKRSFEAINNNLLSVDYLPLLTRLEAKGIIPPPCLQDTRAQEVLGTNIIVGNIILDAALLGFKGISPEKISICVDAQFGPSLPEYVLERRATREPPPTNQKKIFLTDWNVPILDQQDQLNCRAVISDYLMSLAIHDCVERLQNDIMNGELERSKFPRRLDIVVVPLTSDNKFLLGLRSDEVHYEKKHWSIPGEQIDADRDEHLGRVSVSSAIIRTLQEHDELALPPELSGLDLVNCIALATEWHLLLENLIVVVQLKADSVALRHHYQSIGPLGEHKRFDFIDFSIDRMLSVVTERAHELPGLGWTEAPVNDITRFSILAALFHRYGYYPTLQRV